MLKKYLSLLLTACLVLSTLTVPMVASADTIVKSGVIAEENFSSADYALATDAFIEDSYSVENPGTGWSGIWKKNNSEAISATLITDTAANTTTKNKDASVVLQLDDMSDGTKTGGLKNNTAAYATRALANPIKLDGVDGEWTVKFDVRNNTSTATSRKPFGVKLGDGIQVGYNWNVDEDGKTVGTATTPYILVGETETVAETELVTSGNYLNGDYVTFEVNVKAVADGNDTITVTAYDSEDQLKNVKNGTTGSYDAEAVSTVSYTTSLTDEIDYFGFGPKESAVPSAVIRRISIEGTEVIEYEPKDDEVYLIAEQGYTTSYGYTANWKSGALLSTLIPTDGKVTDIGFGSNWAGSADGTAALDSGVESYILSASTYGTAINGIRFNNAKASFYRNLENAIVTADKDQKYVFTFSVVDGQTQAGSKTPLYYHIGSDITVGYDVGEVVSGTDIDLDENQKDNGQYIIPYVEVKGVKYTQDQSVVMYGGDAWGDVITFTTQIDLNKDGSDLIVLTVQDREQNNITTPKNTEITSFVNPTEKAVVVAPVELTGNISYIGFENSSANKKFITDIAVYGAQIFDDTAIVKNEGKIEVSIAKDEFTEAAGYVRYYYDSTDSEGTVSQKSKFWTVNDPLSYYIPTNGTITGKGFATNWKADANGTALDDSKIVAYNFTAGTYSVASNFIRFLSTASIYRSLAAPIVTDGKNGVYTFKYTVHDGISSASSRKPIIFNADDFKVGYDWATIEGETNKAKMTPYIEVGGEKYTNGSLTAYGNDTLGEFIDFEVKTYLDADGVDVISLTVKDSSTITSANTNTDEEVSILVNADLTSTISGIGFSGASKADVLNIEVSGALSADSHGDVEQSTIASVDFTTQSGYTVGEYIVKTAETDESGNKVIKEAKSTKFWNSNQPVAHFIPTDGTITDTGFANNWTYDAAGTQPFVDEGYNQDAMDKYVAGTSTSTTIDSPRRVVAYSIDGLATMRLYTGANPAAYRRLASPIVTNGKDGVYTYTFSTKSAMTSVTGRTNLVAELGDEIKIGLDWSEKSDTSGNDHYITPYVEIDGTKYTNGKLTTYGNDANGEFVQFETRIDLNKDGADLITLKVADKPAPNNAHADYTESVTVTTAVNLTSDIEYIGFIGKANTKVDVCGIELKGFNMSAIDDIVAENIDKMANGQASVEVLESITNADAKAKLEEEFNKQGMAFDTFTDATDLTSGAGWKDAWTKDGAAISVKDDMVLDYKVGAPNYDDGRYLSLLGKHIKLNAGKIYREFTNAIDLSKDGEYFVRVPFARELTETSGNIPLHDLQVALGKAEVETEDEATTSVSASANLWKTALDPNAQADITYKDNPNWNQGEGWAAGSAWVPTNTGAKLDGNGVFTGRPTSDSSVRIKRSLANAVDFSKEDTYTFIAELRDGTVQTQNFEFELGDSGISFGVDYPTVGGAWYPQLKLPNGNMTKYNGTANEFKTSGTQSIFIVLEVTVDADGEDTLKLKVYGEGQADPGWLVTEKAELSGKTVGYVNAGYNYCASYATANGVSRIRSIKIEAASEKAEEVVESDGLIIFGSKASSSTEKLPAMPQLSVDGGATFTTNANALVGPRHYADMLMHITSSASGEDRVELYYGYYGDLLVLEPALTATLNSSEVLDKITISALGGQDLACIPYVAIESYNATIGNTSKLAAYKASTANATSYADAVAKAEAAIPASIVRDVVIADYFKANPEFVYLTEKIDATSGEEYESDITDLKDIAVGNQINAKFKFVSDEEMSIAGFMAIEYDGNLIKVVTDTDSASAAKVGYLDLSYDFSAENGWNAETFDVTKLKVRIFKWDANSYAPLEEVELFTNSVYEEPVTLAHLYVAADAAANGDGSEKLPFATIDEARLAIREMKANDEYPEEGVIVHIAEGDYEQTTPIKFSSDDSGVSEDAPIKYVADGNVRLIGGMGVDLADFEPTVSSDKVYGANIVKYQFEEGTFDIGGDTMPLSGHSTSYLNYANNNGANFVYNETPYFTVSLDEEYMNLARWPNASEGYAIVSGVTNTLRDEKTGVAAFNDLYDFTITCNEMDATDWMDDDFYIHGYWSSDFADYRVTGTVTSPNTIISDYPSYKVALKGQRFYASNAPEMLDTAGEWYIDLDTQTLYLWPTKNEGKVEIGTTTDYVLSASYLKNVEFDGINVVGGRNTAFYLTNPTNVTVKNSRFTNTLKGVTMSAAYNCVIDNCVVAYTGEGGMTLSGGNYLNGKPGNNVISNSSLHDFGMWQKGYATALDLSGYKNIVTNNEIYNSPQQAISIGGFKNEFIYNDIHNLVQEASDMGAIYVGKNPASNHGNIISYNYFHDMASNSSISSTDIGAIFLDDICAGFTITNNIFKDLGGHAVKTNGVREMTVTGNVFVNTYKNANWGSNCIAYDDTTGTYYAPHGDTATDSQNSAWTKYYGYVEADSYLKNGTVKKEPMLSDFPLLANYMEDDPVWAKYNTFKGNYQYGCANDFTVTTGRIGEFMLSTELSGNELEASTQITADQYASISKGDYSAFGIDFSKIGRQTAN